MNIMLVLCQECSYSDEGIVFLGKPDGMLKMFTRFEAHILSLCSIFMHSQNFYADGQPL